MRTAKIVRKTAETDISLTICLDGKGQSDIQTGCGFLDHMLTLFAKHGRFDLTVRCVGDTYVDMATGKAAGLHTIGVKWGFRTEKELKEAGAEFIVDSADELLDIIMNL